jgi:hypothetical protein
MLACRRRVARSEDRGNTADTSGCMRFPFNNFTCCLTLFPKCFSSFDHSTCALSVSGRYLALEGIYLPFRAAFPNNSTRRRSYVTVPAGRIRDSHPLRRPVPRDLDRLLPRSILCKLQLGRAPDFKFELLPLHSPLLGQSLLVSLPPLIDMLKFSGYPYLIRGQPEKEFNGPAPCQPQKRIDMTTTLGGGRPSRRFRGARVSRRPRPSEAGGGVMTLEQACPPGCRGAQCAFKDSMIH